MDRKRGFTLLELLLVIAILSVLASVVLYNLRPSDILNSANRSSTSSNIQDLKKAIEAYAIDKEGALPTSLQALSNSGYYDICKEGESLNCINLDQLINDGYLSDIPVDKNNETTTSTGYKVEYDQSTSSINIVSKSDLNSIVSNGLINYWKTDETLPNSCGSFDTCSSTSSIVMGNWLGNTSSTNGKFSQGIQFDGAGDYVDFGNSNTIEGLNEASICMWMYYRPLSVTSDGSMIGKYKDSDGEHNIGWLFWVDDFAAYSSNENTVGFTVVPDDSLNGKGRVEGTDGLVTPQTWDHYCGVFKGGQYIKLYKKGVVNRTNSDSIVSTVSSNTNTNLTIGMLDNGNRSLDAIIDEVRIYDKALSDQEVSAVYNYIP
ncbi:prepilin-type N-terminal cleavage/methylation domain-containing protein [Candidatus Dojkabacteria bacterium]|nr:prepilin-type N-terminal cleavage/methylation domain-containing protein [Candidatus Dojkabacteria bacterium]